MAQGDVFSAVIPSSLGSIIGGAVVGVNEGQIQGFEHWYANYLQPAFAQWVGAGMKPEAALALLLGDGMPKPGAVQPFVLRYQGNASSLINKSTDTKFGGTLGFTPAGIPILAGLFASLSASTESATTSQTQQQANASFELTVAPVTGSAFMSGLVANMESLGGMTTLPAFLPPPTQTGANAGGGSGNATATAH